MSNGCIGAAGVGQAQSACQNASATRQYHAAGTFIGKQEYREQKEGRVLNTLSRGLKILSHDGLSPVTLCSLDCVLDECLHFCVQRISKITRDIVLTRVLLDFSLHY